MKKDLLIIGAGLSGLYSAYLLQDKYNITIIEARDRIGGRIVTVEEHDLGPSWVWIHHIHIMELINELNLELFEQYEEGFAVYEDKFRLEKFEAQKMMPSYKINGGIYEIINSLKKQLDVTFCINEEVQKVTCQNNSVKVTTSKKEHLSDFVISTLAPRLLVQSIEFFPKLDISTVQKFLSISTWMAHCTKYVVEYDAAFWKEDGLSGFGISHAGPLSEIHDASTKSKFAIMGFVHRDIQTDESQIVRQLVRLFGKKAEITKQIHRVDWKNEKYTATSLDSISEHPKNEGMLKSIYHNKVMFIGSETASLESGYLEGAVISAKEMAETIIEGQK